MRNVFLSSVALLMLALPAAASDYEVVRYASGGYLPACDAPGVVASIGNRFAYQDAHIVYSGVAIQSIDGVRERAFKIGAGFIDRRYCGAIAWLSDGRRSEVVYVIEGPHLGFASIGWHVESCLPGHDPYRVYGAACRSLRP